ncbi:nitrile hydratase subunit alpha [Salinarimonas sp. NSM]|uniref:nitrile hydratase subunit alpha n=1 Tax=Salinarimonas sp. NSM TaxID=3458003 RepID=UPI00403547C0
MTTRGYHDLGGVPAEPFEAIEHALTQWEREVDAIRMLLADDRRRLLNGEEVRRVITSMGAERYDTMAYYERWLVGFKTVLVEKGVLSEAEIDAAAAAVSDADIAPPADAHAHHDHDHDHDHDRHDHQHDDHGHQPDDERHDPFTPEGRRLAEAVKRLLIAKGIVSAADIRETIDFYDSRGAHLGARAVARAWVDPGFRARLLAAPDAALAELGIDLRGTRLCVVENTPAVHNLIVCTLCSCYPRTLLGRPPAWYKSRAYRARAVREPRAILADFGLRLPEETVLRVHDSTADLRYMVLPARPAGTEGLDEPALAALVGRDAMIGTAVARAPEAAR